MTELEAWQWCKHCHGLEIYIGITAITLYIEDQMFQGETLMHAVKLAKEAGF